MYNNMVEEGLVRSSEDVILISVLAWCLYYELCKLTWIIQHIRVYALFQQCLVLWCKRIRLSLVNYLSEIFSHINYPHLD